MNTTVAQNGLGELNLTGLANTDNVGGSTSAVSTACDNLYNYAGSLDSFIDELTEQKDAILLGWEGTAADMLRDNFPKLIEAFEDIPPSIRSIADWATSRMNNLSSLDENAAASLSDILGGGQ